MIISSRWLFTLGLIVFALLIGLVSTAQAGDEGVIAAVTRLKQQGTVERGTDSQPLAVGMSLHLNDTLRTQADARAEITFADGTVLTLGANAQVVLDRFIYDPGATDAVLALSVVQGAFLFVTGKLSEVPHKDVSVTMPVATIGVRGTTFWGGALDNPLDVLLLDGKIEVITPSGAVQLDQEGQGTIVKAPGLAPTPPSFWPPAKKKRAFATVAF